MLRAGDELMTLRAVREAMAVRDGSPAGEEASASNDVPVGGGQDPGPIETGGVADAGSYDPGPIEIDVVMKNVVLTPRDPMAGRDLHLGEVSRSDDADGGE